MYLNKIGCWECWDVGKWEFCGHRNQVFVKCYSLANGSHFTESYFYFYMYLCLADIVMYFIFRLDNLVSLIFNFFSRLYDDVFWMVCSRRLQFNGTNLSPIEKYWVRCCWIVTWFLLLLLLIQPKWFVFIVQGHGGLYPVYFSVTNKIFYYQCLNSYISTLQQVCRLQLASHARCSCVYYYVKYQRILPV